MLCVSGVGEQEEESTLPTVDVYPKEILNSNSKRKNEKFRRAGAHVLAREASSRGKKIMGGREELKLRPNLRKQTVKIEEKE